jgi:predicted histone-like DNA-binding protein
MAIKFKVIEKGQPGIPGGGVKKNYASMAIEGEDSIDELVKDIEKFSALSEPDIIGVIVALENSIQNRLANSRIVRLEKLGTFYPTLSSEGRDTAEEVNSGCVKSVGVNYRPGARIITAMQNAGFKKVDK